MTIPKPHLTLASVLSLGVDPCMTAARLATRLGYAGIWTAETTGFESFSLLSAISSEAPGLALGTGVIPIQLRSAPLAAMGAATLQALNPDREVLLGVGISSPAVVSSWHGQAFDSGRAVGRIREYVTLLRLCLSGERVDFDGDFFQVRGFRLGIRPGQRQPKIVLAALGHQMMRLAGEIADGVLLNYLPASYVEACVAQIRLGGDATIYAYIHAGVADPIAARPLAQRDLFSYAVVDSYAGAFTKAGFGKEVSAIREAHSRRDRQAAVNSVSTTMINSIDFTGTHDEVRAFFNRYIDAGVEVPILMPLPWGPDRETSMIETIEAVQG